MKTIDFNTYKDKIKELLVFKASNNKDRWAIIEIKELEKNLRATADINHEFLNWIINSGWVEKADIIGNGRIECTVRKNLLNK